MLLLLCAEMQQAETFLLEMNFCSHVHTKEMYLKETVIDGGCLFVEASICSFVCGAIIDEGYTKTLPWSLFEALGMAQSLQTSSSSVVLCLSCP